MTIRVRFTISFIIVSVAGLLLATALLMISRRNLRRVESIVQVYDVIEHKSLELSFDLLVMSDAVRGFLLDPHDGGERERKANADREFTRDLAQIRALAPVKRIADLIDAAEKMDDEELDHVENRMLDLAATGKGAEAQELYGSQYLPLRERQTKLITAAEEEAVRAKQQALAEVREEDRRGLMLAAALFVGALAVTALVAVSLGRSVVTPLGRAASTAAAARDGDLSVRVGLGRRQDEIGALSCALDGFLDSLQETSELASAIASGDLRVRVEPRSDRDELGHALERMVQSLARVQKELIDRERLAALGELSASIAHEVRNPLAIIFNSLGSMRRLLKPEGDVALLIDIVAEEADRLNRMVGDLLDYSRPVRPDLEPLPLQALLGDAVTAACRQCGRGADRVTNIVTIEPGAETLRADPRLLRQALVNLFLNAYQAMPQSGTLAVHAACVQRNGVSVSELHIKDTGCGIPPEARERLFEPFFTTKAMGTGLGLAVVRRIIEGHGGSIELASGDSGAEFCVRLPQRSMSA